MSRPAGLLWDESFLWGLMSIRAFEKLGLSFELLRAEDIRAGGLEGRPLLFVPGGWASNKLKALGEDGAEIIRRYVQGGGNYLGICGGAGLATKDGIGLLNIKRKPTKERVPSFSGRISLSLKDKHPIFEGLQSNEFHAWWPSQFVVEDESISILARYDTASPESFSSDLNVGDVIATTGWDGLEESYRINLNPARLYDDPAVLEGKFGKGKVILSLVHFDTPWDSNGNIALGNTWEYLGGAFGDIRGTRGQSNAETPDYFVDHVRAVEELISLGERNFLWFWRNPMLFQWRRGVRGLEYCTLYVLVKEIASLLQDDDTDAIRSIADGLREPLLTFTSKAKELLVLERIAMQGSRLTFDECEDERIRALRLELFSSSKSHGGMFKDVIDRSADVLYATRINGATLSAPA